MSKDKEDKNEDPGLRLVKGFIAGSNTGTIEKRDPTCINNATKEEMTEILRKIKAQLDLKTF